MNETDLKTLETHLSMLISEYVKKYDTMNADERVKAIMAINKESSTINDIDKKNSDNADKKKRSNLENRKYNADLRENARKSNIDFDKQQQTIDYNNKLYSLEYDKFEHEKAEAARAHSEKRIDSIVHVVEIVAPLAVYASLMLINLKLVYVDRGITPSSMNDLIRNVAKK